MSIAKLAWLTSPDAGRYVLNFQFFGSEDVIQIELGPDHMRNILSDGVPLMLRQSFHRVPISKPEESVHGTADINAQRTA
jgi:hypothetical protein